ncbi:DNA/RNA non-specific endonuclease [Lactiplantibacillus plajomi]
MNIILMGLIITLLISLIWHGRQHHWHSLATLTVLLLITGSFLSACSQETETSKPATKTVTKTKVHRLTESNDQKLTALISANASSSKQLKADATSLSKRQQRVETQRTSNQKAGATKTTKAATVASGQNPSNAALANKAYGGQQTITINQNRPAFSKAELSTQRGAWQTYGNLDGLNRATAANALLNKSLMPTDEREPLNVEPTGWHNKRIASGWLYNRSHLIGFQLTGQNNNLKNLMTGTRSLNDPEMVTYENQVADYLKESSRHYVRYQVTPIFKGNELLARGVQMRAQSIGDNAVSFNVYIFNVQAGMRLNYQSGTSRVQH